MAATKSARTFAIPSSSSATGAPSPGNAWSVGPTGVQPPSDGGTDPRPSHGRRALALRPACASWTPASAPCAWTNATIRDHAAACSSFQIPVSCGLIRPSGLTAVASLRTTPAPPTARAPRCTRCQSSGMPSVAEYWHMGATQMRLRAVAPRRVKGSNSRLMLSATLREPGAFPLPSRR